jgi:tetratricopeptide (TPR) repeat protein
MRRLAGNYGQMNRFTESTELFEKVLAHRKDLRVMRGFAEVCLWAGKLDRADVLLREVLQLARKEKDSANLRNLVGNIRCLLALKLLLQERYDEAEPLAREALALNQLYDRRRYYLLSILGASLMGKGKYTEAEPLLLQGYEGMKEVEARHPAERRRIGHVIGWLVRFHELTKQPQKAQEWRDKLNTMKQATVKFSGVK